MEQASLPPKTLVQTWVTLIKSNENGTVRQHATNQLINTFGSLESAIQYCVNNGISIK